MKRMWAALCMVSVMGLGCASEPEAPPQTEPLRVITANPVEAGIHALAETFAEETGREVTVEVMGTGAINELLASDEPADVLIGTTASIDQAIADGRVLGDKTYVARVGIGVVVREGADAPDVGTPEALRQAALDADRVIFNTAGSGQYVERMFAGLGIGDEVLSKSDRPGSGVATMERLIAGTGSEIAFGLLSEVRPFEGNGVVMIGRLPDEIQNYTVYDAVVLSRSLSPAASVEFIQYLTAGEAREVFARSGVDQ